ncbi:hypothetical protein WA026_008423 [Henosepilachna vigintioctopunctata]|uniref:Uncharacterized protein n=1 Tax=Henosepilachna vigintioctopunctata TaxID=420089 RepID=A0AAW1UAF6_9CUCU
MDEPGISIFQSNGLSVGNNENQEEAEDLEEQIRRREELQNLLIHELDEFNYEDSTVNSSNNISVTSIDYIEQTYGDSQTPYEQLKLLYDIRMKEIQSLKEEFDNFKSNAKREIDNLKRKLTLQEAETSQVEISWRNTKSILVDKMEIITKQERELVSKIEEIEKLKKIIEQLQYDMQAHKATIEELNLKMAMDTSPFNVAARAFNSEELQNKHKEQIEKLESFLGEYQRKIEILSKEKDQLEDDLQKKITNNDENERLYNKTIALLNANVESAQNQCKDLLNLIEVLSKENEHIKGRILKLESGDPIILSNSFKRKSLDYETLFTHNERLKKMLLDRDFELSTLKSKVKFYESDMRELIEYRSIRHKSLFNKECSQSEHVGNIALMQYELNNVKSDVIDKEREILELTSINKELENKIETMIIQTRNELEIISNKYKVPELESMKEELQHTEMRIKELQQKILKAENEAEEMRIKLHENDVKLKEKEKKLQN